MIDLSIVGKKLGPVPFNYTWKDVVLYALGIGAQTDELLFGFSRKYFVPPHRFTPKIPPVFRILGESGQCPGGPGAIRVGGDRALEEQGDIPGDLLAAPRHDGDRNGLSLPSIAQPFQEDLSHRLASNNGDHKKHVDVFLFEEDADGVRIDQGIHKRSEAQVKGISDTASHCWHDATKPLDALAGKGNHFQSERKTRIGGANPDPTRSADDPDTATFWKRLAGEEIKRVEHLFEALGADNTGLSQHPLPNALRSRQRTRMGCCCQRTFLCNAALQKNDRFSL